MDNLFGTKIRSLWEAQVLMQQRHVAYHLDIDSLMLSNVERGERKARLEWVSKLTQQLNLNEDELLTAWLPIAFKPLRRMKKLLKTPLNGGDNNEN